MERIANPPFLVHECEERNRFHCLFFKSVVTPPLLWFMNSATIKMKIIVMLLLQIIIITRIIIITINVKVTGNKIL